MEFTPHQMYQLIDKCVARYELRDICQLQFTSVFNSFKLDESHSERINKLIDYVDKHNEKKQELLKTISEYNPDRYEEFLQKILNDKQSHLENHEKETEYCHEQSIAIDYGAQGNKIDELRNEIRVLKQQLAVLQKKHSPNRRELVNSLGSLRYRSVIQALKSGELVFFLGSEFNRFGRSAKLSSAKYPPTAKEMVEELISKHGTPQEYHVIQCPLRDSSSQGESLMQNATLQCPVSEAYAHIGEMSLHYISQLVRLEGSEIFLDDIKEIFQREYLSTNWHTFLATLPNKLRQKKFPYPYQLIVTNNYDDVLEQTFRRIPEEFDLIYYDTKLKKFVYQPWEGEIQSIGDPNIRLECLLTKRTVILKIHGAISLPKSQNPNLVITENDYISYLLSEDPFEKLPVNIRNKLLNTSLDKQDKSLDKQYKNQQDKSRILFLGYIVRNWSERIFLNLFWELETSEKYSEVKTRRISGRRSWAIHYDPDLTERRLWGSYREIDVIDDISEEKYIEGLDREISTLVSHGDRV